MLILPRTRFLALIALPLAATLTSAVAQTTTIPALPPAPPAAVPAFVDVVTFEFFTDGENHKVVVTNSPNLLRVDEPDDGYTIIYNPQTEHYTGLEHRNDTYWEFSWPEVSSAVQNSKRYETRLQQLNSEGFSGDTTVASTNAPDAATASVGTDNSGYVWHATTDQKRIAGLDCIRWTGDTVSGENVEVWCYAGPVPKLQAAVERLRTINEPIALVPVRTIVPDFIFLVYDALVKGGVTPVLMTWGGDQDKNRFAFVEAKTRDGKPSLFTVPKLYIKTTLITMDGMMEQKK